MHIYLLFRLYGRLPAPVRCTENVKWHGGWCVRVAALQYCNTIMYTVLVSENMKLKNETNAFPWKKQMKPKSSQTHSSQLTALTLSSCVYFNVVNVDLETLVLRVILD